MSVSVKSYKAETRLVLKLMRREGTVTCTDGLRMAGLGRWSRSLREKRAERESEQLSTFSPFVSVRRADIREQEAKYPWFKGGPSEPQTFC